MSQLDSDAMKEVDKIVNQDLGITTGFKEKNVDSKFIYEFEGYELRVVLYEFVHMVYLYKGKKKLWNDTKINLDWFNKETLRQRLVKPIQNTILFDIKDEDKKEKLRIKNEVQGHITMLCIKLGEALENGSVIQPVKKEEEVIEEEDIPKVEPTGYALLDAVRNVYKKWLHIEDTDIIDIVLAMVVAHKMLLKHGGKPVWLTIVGSSSCGKTETARPVLAWNESYLLTKMNTKALITGNKDRENDHIADMDKKIVVIPDWAELLATQKDARTEIFSQLRNVYDGQLKYLSGMNKGKKAYDGLRITMLGCATPAIYRYYSKANLLGTRELFFDAPNADKNSIMKKVDDFQEKEEEMKEEIAQTVVNFINTIRTESYTLSDEEKKKIQAITGFITVFRASAPINFNELAGEVDEEGPARVYGQLTKLYKSLMALDNNYKQEDAFRILKKVAESSIDKNRWKVYKILTTEDQNLREVYRKSRLGMKTVRTCCEVLYNQKLATMTYEEDAFGRISKVFYSKTKEKQETIDKFMSIDK